MKTKILFFYRLSLFGLFGIFWFLNWNQSAQATAYCTTDSEVNCLVDDGGERLFYTDYSSLGESETVRPIWQSEQEPRSPGSEGELQTDRITIVGEEAVPGSNVFKPEGPVMRVELRPYTQEDGTPGDRQVSGSSTYNRAEVYDRHAVPGGTPAAQWPDPVGSTRWYGINIFIPSDFEQADSGTVWMTVTQWKGFSTGSPPLALEIDRGNFELGSSTGGRLNLGSINKGSWTNFVFGIHHSNDASEGWFQIYKNGTEIVAKTFRETMETKSGGSVDPGYFKQGIYRSTAWDTTNVVYFGPTTIGTTMGSVAPYLLTSAQAADETAPEGPTDLTASEVSTSGLTLSWTAATDNIGVTGYRIFRDGVQIGFTDETSYEVTGLSDATEYSFTVTALDAAGNDDSTGELLVTTLEQSEEDSGSDDSGTDTESREDEEDEEEEREEEEERLEEKREREKKDKEAPWLEMTGLRAGERLPLLAFVKVRATDNQKIDHMRVYVNSRTKKKKRAPIISYTLGRILYQGVHTFQVMAKDKRGNIKTMTVDIRNGWVTDIRYTADLR